MLLAFDRFLAFRPVLGRAVGPGQIVRGIDQRDMREGLRIVANLPPRLRIVLLGKEADIVAQLEQPLE